MTDKRNITDEEVERQWQRFKAGHPDLAFQPSIWTTRAKAIAASVSLAVVIAVGAILVPTLTEKQPVETDTIEPTTSEIQTVEEKELQFVFHDVTLADALEEISDFYRANIVVHNEEAMQLRLYIQMDKALELEDAIAFLNNLEKVNLRLEGGSIIVE